MVRRRNLDKNYNDSKTDHITNLGAIDGQGRVGKYSEIG